MIEKLRLFLVIIEEGSLRRAAERLHISQSAITRQIQLLEHDLGGQILERASSGVRPTIGGQALARKARGLLADYDSVMAEIRRLVRGESDRLRIGYLASAMQEYFGPALAELRRAFPKLKVSHGKEGECPTLCVPCWTVFNSRPSLKANYLAQS